MSELMKHGVPSNEAVSDTPNETADDVFDMLRLIGMALLAVLGLGLGAVAGLLIAAEMGWVGFC